MGIKERVTARVVDLFSHSERPLQNTEKYEAMAKLGSLAHS